MRNCLILMVTIWDIYCFNYLGVFWNLRAHNNVCGFIVTVQMWWQFNIVFHSQIVFVFILLLYEYFNSSFIQCMRHSIYISRVRSLYYFLWKHDCTLIFFKGWCFMQYFCFIKYNDFNFKVVFAPNNNFVFQM